MDKHSGQRPFTDEELAQALRLGTDAAARRQGTLRAGVLARVQAPARRRPLWQTLAASAAAVVLLMAALWALSNRLPQWDVVQPLATNTPQIPTITLTTNIQAYTPALSSVQGITITARDSLGNPMSGDWKASWGVFLGPVTEQGNLIPGSGDYADTLHGAARALWSFAPDAGEIPANIRITFTAADGQSATLLLTQDRERMGFVRVAASVNRLTLLTNTDHYTYDPDSPFVGGFQMLLSAVDAQGGPVDGDWKASFGAFGGNATDGFVTTMKDTSSVIWQFVALIGQGVPETAEITFIAEDGRTQTLHLVRDPQDDMTLRIRADEIQPLAAVLQSPPVLRCNAEGCANQYNRNLISSLKIEAVEADGSAIAGVWKASYGRIDVDSALSSSTYWSFSAEDSASIPQTVEIAFYAQSGSKTTLFLDRDADNPNLMKVRENGFVLIPQAPSTSAPVATATPTATKDEVVTSGPPGVMAHYSHLDNMNLPIWQRSNQYQGEYRALMQEKDGRIYPQLAVSQAVTTELLGSLTIPDGWTVKGQDLDLAFTDATGQPAGSLYMQWLEMDQFGTEYDPYSLLMPNHVEDFTLEKLEGFDYLAYRLMLDADYFPTTDSHANGEIIRSLTVFLPNILAKYDGKTYAVAYVLDLNKAIVNYQPEQNLLSNQTINDIAKSWQPPQVDPLAP